MVSRHGVIATKLCPPEPRANDIDRCPLLERVNFDRRPRLVTLRAPAGYGKSAFAVQLVRSWGMPAAWYQLDREDDDTSVFVRHLVASIEQHTPALHGDVGTHLDMSAFETDPSRLVAPLVNAFRGVLTSGMVLVLEDCQYIRNASIRLLVQELVAHAPPHVTFVLTSRNQLPLNTSRYQAALEAVVLGVDDLRFSDPEVAAVLTDATGSPDPDLVAAICRECEGWPAVVRLIASDRDAMSGARWRELPQAVNDYLQSEVVACHPESVCQFLKATSMLDFLTPELCDAYMEADDSVHILRSLREEQLLMPVQSDLGPAFRYLYPLRRFLQSTLGAERRAFLIRAGECERLMGRAHCAVDHFLSAGATKQAIDTMKEAGDEFIRSGQYDLLRRWIEVLPSTIVRADPWLSMCWGLVNTPQGRLDTAQVYLENALGGFRSRGDRCGMAQARLGLARILVSRGKYERGRELIDKAVPVVIQHKSDLIPETLAQKALLLAVCGQMDEAISTVSEAMRSAQLSGDQDIMVRVAADVSHVYYLRGDYSAVLQMRHTAFADAVGYRQARDALDTALSRPEAFAIALRDMGELSEALDHARRSLDFKDSHGLVEWLPSAYCQLAAACVDQGEFGRAEECFSRAMEIVEATGGQRFFVALCLSGLARIKCLQGRLVEAQTYAEQALEVAHSLRSSPYLEIMCSMTTLVIHVLAADFQTALSMALDIEDASTKAGIGYVAAVNQGLLASIYDAIADHNAALEHASRCLSACARGRYAQEFITFYRVFAPVLRAGLELGIEIGFVHHILARAGQPALDLLVEMAGHPDPQVRQRAAISLSQEEAASELETTGGVEAESGRLVYPVADADVGTILWSSDSSLVSIREDYLRISIQCLGPFRVSAGGREILPQDWRTTKARDLLAYLVHRKGPVQSDVILEELWPGSESEQTRAVLHTNLYYLRRALHAVTDRDEVVVFGGGHYRLADGCYTTDVDRFGTLLSAALSRNGGTVTSPELLEKAIALYKGDYLEGMDYPWVGAEQRRLKRVCLDARERLIRHYLETGDCSKALPHALTLAEACPLSEDAHVLAMMVYSRLGDLASVKEQYRLMSDLFDEELGSSPSPEVKRLYYSLCTGKH